MFWVIGDLWIYPLYDLGTRLVICHCYVNVILGVKGVFSMVLAHLIKLVLMLRGYWNSSLIFQESYLNLEGSSQPWFGFSFGVSVGWGIWERGAGKGMCLHNHYLPVFEELTLKMTESLQVSQMAVELCFREEETGRSECWQYRIWAWSSLILVWLLLNIHW